MSHTFILAILLTLLIGGTKDPILTESSDLLSEYDFIVGPSGSVLANRLTEIANVSVLLLEAGLSDLQYPATQIPHSPLQIHRSPTVWNSTVVRQKHALLSYDGQISPWIRGIILGGTAAINGMVYHRGSSHDYDSWSDKGADGWSWNDVQPYFKKVERATQNGLSENLGRTGPLKLTARPVTKMGKTFTKAALDAGFPHADYLDDNMEGVGPITQNVYNSLRQGPAEAYLRTVLPERKNRLHVVTGAHASKIVFNDEKRAVGVEFYVDGKRHYKPVLKEIILSAGAAGTPQLLLLSGIGPRDHLDEHGIDVVVDSPGVGSNLQDHTFVRMFYRVNDSKEKDILPPEREVVAEYIMNGMGPATIPQGYDIALHTKTKYFGAEHSLSSKEYPYPELQILFRSLPEVTYKTDSDEDGGVGDVGMVFAMLHPKSTGTIRLRSRDPFQQPLIDPNLFYDEDDVLVHVEGFRTLEKIESTKTLSDIGFEMIMPSYCNGSENQKTPRSDEFYRCLTRARVSPGCHACCTAAMGRDDDKMAVLDSRLRVRGVQGLRVADASAMVHVTSGNTQAPCYMIGEKAADMIKQDWAL